MTPRTILLCIFLACSASLGAAFVAQHFFDLEPCALCIYQRYPFAVALLVSAAGLAARPPAKAARVAAALCSAAFISGAAIAAFHVGVEQGWWAGLATCTGSSMPSDMTIAELQEALKNPVSGPSCSDVAWSLFGISMAGYNVIWSFVLAAGALVATRKMTGGR